MTDFLRSLSPDFQLVKGEFDENPVIALSKVTTHDELRIGFTNGFTILPNGDSMALLTTARQMDVDILLYGGTSRVEAYTLDGKFFINPGSATGAFSSKWPDNYEPLTEATESDRENGYKEKGNSVGEEEPKKQDLFSASKRGDPIPSFCLLDVQGPLCVLYIYSIFDGEVKVDRVSYQKDLNV